MLEFLAFLHVTIWPLVVVLAICGALIVHADWRVSAKSIETISRLHRESEHEMLSRIDSLRAENRALAERVGKLELQRGIKG